jgi:nitrogen fixation protein NifU and related proteins
MDLYSKVILELSKYPPNYSEREDAKHEIKAFNSYCGDKFKVQLDYDVQAKAVSFMGYGCAVSKASAAILTECAKEKTWRELHDICVKVLDFLNGEEADIADVDERLDSFSVVRNYPGRYECAALCWEEMRKYSSIQMNEGEDSGKSD